MFIRTSCPRCFVELQVPADAQGRDLRCTQCGNVFVLDAPGEPVEPPDVLPAEPDDMRNHIVRQTLRQLPPPAAYTSGRSRAEGGCKVCQSNVPTWNVGFHQHIGAVVLMFHKQIDGNLCRPCIDKFFWDYTTITLFCGWWGMLSFFITPFCLLMNVVSLAGTTGAPVTVGDSYGGGEFVAPNVGLRVRIPAIGMIATSCLALVWGIFGLVVLLGADAQPKQPAVVIAPDPNGIPVANNPRPVKAREDGWFRYLWLVQAGIGGLIILGSVQMWRLKTYPLAMLATILASIPMLGPCCVLALPFGIWGFVVLCNRDVRAAFG